MLVKVLKKSEIIEIFVILSLLLALDGTGRAQASSARPSDSNAESEIQCGPGGPSKINLTIGKSAVIQCQESVKRISIAAPEIADATALSPRQIYITGKSAGLTNLLLWDSQDKVRAIEVEVAPDTTGLKGKLHEMFPDESNIKVTTSNGKIVLSGTVSSLSKMTQVMAIAAPYAACPKEEKQQGGTQVFATTEGAGGQGAEKECTNITNLLEIGGVQQVMLEVRVSEIQRSLAKRLGINFNYVTESGKMGVSILKNLTYPQHLPGFDPFFTSGTINPTNEIGTVLSRNINGVLRFSSNDTTWYTFIDALKENGLVKVLAEPSLLTLSGQEANFLAGGEFPIPVPQDFESIGIVYKQFGVALSFTPTVLSNGHINMKVAPEVSELDFSNAVAIAGIVIPALSTRKVQTSIELADGQSFAIAGLLRDDVREVATKFPLLGDIPVLGALFRSSAFQKNETELVVIVTPKLVKPLDMSKQTLPTDQFIEPNDLEFYLNGQVEGRGEPKTGAPEAKLPTSAPEGKIGYIVPQPEEK
jgi:pilus assembly protein CpaC